METREVGLGGSGGGMLDLDMSSPPLQVVRDFVGMLPESVKEGGWEVEGVRVGEEESPSREGVSSEAVSMVTWIQPVGVTLVVRLEDEPLLKSEMFRAAIMNCFS